MQTHPEIEAAFAAVEMPLAELWFTVQVDLVGLQVFGLDDVVVRLAEHEDEPVYDPVYEHVTDVPGMGRLPGFRGGRGLPLTIDELAPLREAVRRFMDEHDEDVRELVVAEIRAGRGSRTRAEFWGVSLDADGAVRVTWTGS